MEEDSKNSVTYRHEAFAGQRFFTWQGEGVHTGRSAYLFDSKDVRSNAHGVTRPGLGIPDWVPKDVEKISPKTLAEDALESGCEIVVLTGGEPTIYDLEDLTLNFQRENFPSMWKPVAVILSEVHLIG